jgi:hypothetical protein
MSQSHDLPGLVPGTPFAGGQAPACWRREMTRCTANLGALHSVSSWVKAFRVHLALCDGPLLGHTLPDVLADQDDHPATPKPEPRPRPMTQRQPKQPGDSGQKRARKRRSAPPQPDQPGTSPHRRQRPRWSNALSRHDATAVTTQPARQARSTLLKRLAGNTAVPHHTSSDPPRLVKTRLPDASSPDFPNAAHQAKWRREVARRAGHALDRDELDGRLASRHPQSEQPASDETPEPAASGGALEAVAPGARPSLAAAWDRPFNGPTAPADLLADLDGRRETGHGRTVPEPQTGNGRQVQPARPSQPATDVTSPDLPARHAPDNRQAGPMDRSTVTARSSAKLDRLPVAERDHARPAPPGTARQRQSEDWPSPWPDEPLPATGEPAVDGTPTSAQKRDLGGRPAVPVRVAPPAVAPTLPPLRAPQPPVTIPPPVATAVVRQDAVQEAAAAADLNVLAANLKRILDEEARRHGIDV